MSQIERNNNGNDGNDSSAFRVYMYDVFTTKFSVLLLFQHATLSNVLEYILITVVYCYLPVRAKNGITLLLCIYESTV